MAEGVVAGGAGDELVVVLTTAPSAGVAEGLVRALVDQRLVACGNLVPRLRSIYRWGGEVVAEEEVLVLMKTRRGQVERLFAEIAARHPYEVPELVALPVDSVSSAYAQWVRQETIEVNR